MTTKKKIYGFNNGGSTGWYSAVAIGEDGAHLASHICSSEGFMPHDLGMDGRSDWKHDIYDKHFGAGNWETEFVSYGNVEKHAGLQKALELNKQAGESEHAEKVSVEVEATT